MPADSNRSLAPAPTMNAYAQVCRLSTRYERAAASVVMERLVDAGLSYAEAAATVRDQRAAWQAAGGVSVEATLGRTRIAGVPLQCRGRQARPRSSAR